MLPGTSDIADLWRGATYDRGWRLLDANGAIVDLTGSVVVFRLVGNRDETPVIRKATTQAPTYHTDETTVLSGFRIVGDPANGEVWLTLNPEETRSIPAGASAKYEIERRIAGRQEVLVHGQITAGGGINDES